jgi:hypothetical protein
MASKLHPYLSIIPRTMTSDSLSSVIGLHGLAVVRFSLGVCDHPVVAEHVNPGLPAIRDLFELVSQQLSFATQTMSEKAEAPGHSFRSR